MEKRNETVHYGSPGVAAIFLLRGDFVVVDEKFVFIAEKMIAG